MPLSKKRDFAQWLYGTQPLSRYFIREAYTANGAIYYRGTDNVLRVIKGD